VVAARISRALTQPRVLIAGLALLVALMVVASVLVGKLYVDKRAESGLRTDVLAAARQQVINFTTLDYRRFDQGSEQLLAGSTGDFAEQYRANIPQLKDLVVKNKTVSKGKILEAGMVTADAGAARVLVVADSDVSNTATKQPMPRHYRMQLDLVHKDGRWLTTDMQFVG
jgi:Mce-associated membrane protein